jgi:pimeloyl-ACP methyl ester carboxylesterase
MRRSIIHVMKRNRIGTIASSVALVFLIGAAVQAQESGPVSIVREGYVFAGGKYKEVKGKQVMAGQLYAEFQIPAKQTSPYPVVMIHGGGVSGNIYMGTPDGHEGWAEFFLRKGYAVYVVDQVGRGRSGYQSDVYGPAPGSNNVEFAQKREISTELFNLWPQASLHTQRPGTGKLGDPWVDAFAASEMPGITGFSAVSTLNRDAIIALLEKIGPSILITHSQSGPPGWLVADNRPEMVKALISIEGGLPFYDVDFVGAPEWFKDGPKRRPWGLTSEPIHYSPPVSDPSEIALVEQDKADGPDLAKCWLQKEPARQLPNLQKVPILLLTGEASFHAPTDQCIVKHLEQAGVHPTWVKLGDAGIHGNGHMMMQEKNNLDIAEVITKWLAKTMSSKKS